MPHQQGDPGVYLERTDEKDAEIGALAARLAAHGGGRRDLEVLVDDLDRRGRRTRLPLPTVHRAWTWDAADRRDKRWWPQGVTTSADASPSGRVSERRLVVVAWYAKVLPGDPEGGHGVRVSFFDPDRSRYRHVLLVVPEVDGDEGGGVTARPLRAHAGGLVWTGSHLHVAATARGFYTCRLDDLLHVPESAAEEHFGYRYLLPVRFSYRAGASEGTEPLRYSFMSLDRSADPPELVVGEYARGSQTRRFAHFPLDPDTGLLHTDDAGAARPRLAEGVQQMQGVVVVDGSYIVTTSHGPWGPGSVWSGPPGSLREQRWATPMGPEDITYWPQTDELWSATEHPRRRWIYAMRASRFR